MPNHNHSLLAPTQDDFWSINVTPAYMSTRHNRYPGCIDSNGNAGQQYVQNNGASPYMNYIGGEGGNQAHNNLPPYRTAFVYRRKQLSGGGQLISAVSLLFKHFERGWAA